MFVAGTYRCKMDNRDEVLYMGAIENDLKDHKPIGRLSDFALKAKVAPAWLPESHHSSH